MAEDSWFRTLLNGASDAFEQKDFEATEKRVRQALFVLADTRQFELVRWLVVSRPPAVQGDVVPRAAGPVKRDDTLLFYIEYVGANLIVDGDDVRHQLRVFVESTPASIVRHGRYDELVATGTRSRFPSHEGFITFTYQYKGYPPGPYRIDFRIVDTNAGEEIIFSHEFVVE